MDDLSVKNALLKKSLPILLSKAKVIVFFSKRIRIDISKIIPKCVPL